MSLAARNRLGMVFFVGAGPGDPGLITLRGVQCLRSADLILYDYLANPVILKHAPQSAEAVCLGHHGQQHHWTQQKINQTMIEAAREGKRVVRLKGGDPSLFAHAAEEIEALVAAGIPYQTIPGVTSALAAAGYAEIPITHGQYCSAVALVTGQERHNKQAPPLDFRALACFPGTLVIYMGVTTAKRWSEALIRGGKPADTPAVVVRRCSWPDQQTFRCTLGSVAEVIARHRLTPPAVIIVGQVASLGPEVSWFAQRPLFGQRVLVTRPRHQAESLCDRLAELGADVLVQPALEILAPDDWQPVDEALAHLDQYHWIVFSSANGVQYFLDRLCQARGDVRRLGGIRLAAIGPATAERLWNYHLRADLVAPEYRAEALAEALAPEASGKRFLLVRASRGREVLAERLASAGAEVQQVRAYRSVDVTQPDPHVASALAQGRIHWITVTSSAIAEALARMFGANLHRARLASISPITSETLRRLGFSVAAEATRYTMEGLIDALLAAEAR